MDEKRLDQVGDEEKNCVSIKVGDTVDPDYVNASTMPNDSFDHPYDQQNTEHPFSEVENPGGWSSYSFHPNFVSNSNGSWYKDHCIPTGCVPVSKYQKRECIINDWHLYLKCWKRQGYEVHVRYGGYRQAQCTDT